MDIDADALNELIAKRRPPVIHRQEDELEYDVLDSARRIVETKKGKYVVEESIVRVTTKRLVIREFDPEANYGDAITEFIGEDNATKD